MLAVATLAVLTLLPVQDDAAPAVAETDAKVRDFLSEAESQLYHPDAEGLNSLEFDIAMTDPMAGDIATIRVSWETGRDATYDVEMGEDLPMPPPVLENFRKTLPALGESMLYQQLNRTASMLLDKNVARLDGVEDELIKVTFTPKATVETPVGEQTMLFDDEGVLRKARATVEQMGMTLKASETLNWKPVSAESDLLILESKETEQDMGVMKQSQTTTFHYGKFDKWTLVTGMSVKAMGMTQEMKFDNFVVNGEAVTAGGI